MKTKSVIFLAATLSLLAAVTIFPAATSAQDQDQQDPPSRVARLGYVEGSVSYEPAGEQDWVQADVDRPLTTGDSLWADQNSRGELHVGSTALRLGSQTGISFLNLNDQAVQIQLAQGSLSIHVRRVDQDDAYEIDAPNLAFTINSPGDYRLDVDPNGNTTSVTTLAGQGTVTGGGQTWNVTPGQRAVFNGTDQLAYSVQGVGNDSFEGWSRSREMREEHLASARYVSPDVTGYEDLDENGQWHSDPQYGAYWVPNRVDADWAPYHEGHWAWVAPWGWTWVDAQPWGFAPYHYGRWAMFGDNWGWVPGPVADTRCVYAPALVGFVGGGGFSVAVGFGGGEGVAWFPLGPRDVYVPPYQVSQRYVEQVNVSNTTVINRTTITNVYTNYTVNHVTNVNYTYANNTRAVTAVNRQAFVSGTPVTKAAIRVNAQDLQHPRVVTTAALTPTRASVVGAAAASRAVPPRTMESRKVVTKMTPSPQATPLGRPRPQANPNLSAAMVNRAGFSPQAQSVHAAAAAKAVTSLAANRPGAEAQPNRPATPNETRPNEARPNEARPNEARPNETRSNETRPNETRPNEAQPNQPRPNETRPNETRPNETRPNETRPNETRPSEAQPNRPATQPARPFTPPNETRKPEAQPNRPATPNETRPNEARPNETRPNETRPNETRPSQPRPNETRPTETRPNETRPNEAQPNRPATPPSETRKPETQPTRPATPPTEQRRPETQQPKTVTPPPQEKRSTPPPKEQPKPDEKEKPKPKPKPEPQPQQLL